MSEIRIHKFPERKFYAKIPNFSAQDARLSFGARGLLTYLLSLPDNFVIYKKQIIKNQNIKRRLLDNYFDELEMFQYLVCAENQGTDSGKFDAKQYSVYSVPDNQVELIFNPSPMLPQDIGSVTTGHRTDGVPSHSNAISPISMKKEISNKLELARQVLGVMDSLKDNFCPGAKKIRLKVSKQRVGMVMAREKDFHDLWGKDRDFLKACKFCFEYKAREWSGTEMWKYFQPETLLVSENFIKYLEAAEESGGKKKVAGVVSASMPDGYHK